ncbi:hypothetical protein LPJ57_003579, partial [Coemansia sp. RSA 486]
VRARCSAEDNLGFAEDNPDSVEDSLGFAEDSPGEEERDQNRGWAAGHGLGLAADHRMAAAAAAEDNSAAGRHDPGVDTLPADAGDNPEDEAGSDAGHTLVDAAGSGAEHILENTVDRPEEHTHGVEQEEYGEEQVPVRTTGDEAGCFLPDDFSRRDILRQRTGGDGPYAWSPCGRVFRSATTSESLNASASRTLSGGDDDHAICENRAMKNDCETWSP